ncbi:MAG: hypothetical protein COX17_00610 [Deltaproteobacteria bacterium CG23_combo_of_CG06-09_8_20_14_all_60_8]|nr:MAG: hypothetical protein COX17_00610 [Deltaproteobacteria bacterium CG23_combo_of_CG06-09_8_20_14_all_60_8]
MEKLVKQIIGYFHEFRFRSWPRNWGLKLLSFILAIFLWYFVVGEDKVDLNLFVPIEIVNLPRDLVISNQFKKELEVTISGPRGLVRGLGKQTISRPVDLSKAKPGKVVIRNEANAIPLSRGITVQRIQPANITLQLERLVTKELPIKTKTKGKLPAGLELVSMTLEPTTINASGPENILSATESISTQPIDLGEIKNSTEVPATLDLPPELTDLIGEMDVLVHVTVREKKVEMALPQVLVEVDHDGERSVYRLKPATVQVRAEVPYFLLQKTTGPVFLVDARINARGLPPGRHDLPVTVTATEGVRITDVSPKTIHMTIGAANPVKKRRPGAPAHEKSTPAP